MGTNYLLLGLIVEQVTGRSVAEVLRSGVLDGDGYERLIFQPDERPTARMRRWPVDEPRALTNAGGSASARP